MVRKHIVAFFLYVLVATFFLKGVLVLGIVIGSDWSLPLTNSQMEVLGERGLYTWSDSYNILGARLSRPNIRLFNFLVSLLPKVGIGGDIFTKILLVSLFSLIGFSSYYFCRKIELSFKSSLLAGFIYMTTPLVFNYSIMGWVFVLWAMAIMPFFILAFKYSIETQRIYYSIIGGFLFAFTFFQSPVMFVFPLLMVTSFPFLVSSKREFFVFIRSFLVILFIVVLLNTNWVLPFIFFPDKEITRSVSSYDIGRFESRLNLPNMIRLWGGLFNYQFETVYPKFLLPISFALPMFSFLALILMRKDKKVLHLATVAFLPLIIYSLRGILHRLPFSNVIRDFSRMMIISAFPYSVLAAITFEKAGKIKKNVLAKLLSAMIVLVLFLNSLPFWAGELYGEPKLDCDQRLRTLEFPLEYKEAEIFLSKNLRDTKALQLPSGLFLGFLDNKKFSGPYKEAADIFTLFSRKPGVFAFSDKIVGPPVDYGKLILNAIENSKTTELRSFFKLTPIDTFVIRKNAYGDGGKGPEIEKTIERLPGVIKTFDKSKISVFTNNYFFPHFYIPQNIIYSNGNIESLFDIVNFDNWNLRPAIFLADNVDEARRALTERADEIFIKTDLGKKMEIDKVICLRGCIAEREIFYPHVKHEPGSSMHKLALLREEWNEWKARKDPERLIEKKLFYASKRVSEIEKLDMVNEQLTKTLERYKQKIEETIDLVENEEQGEKIWQYLEQHEEKLRDLEIKKLGDLEEVFEKLYQKLAEVYQRPGFNLRNLEYSFEIPRAGEYELFIKTESGEEVPVMQVELVVDGENIATKESRLRKGKWMNFGKRNFKEGEYKLILHLGEAENLIGKKHQQLNGSEGKSVVSQEIKSYTTDTVFRISFDYRVQNGKASFSIIQDIDKDEERGEINSLITRKLRRTRGEEFEQVEIFFKSSPRASSAKLYLFAQPGKGKVADVSFKNVKVEKALAPTVLLQAKTDEVKAVPITPEITFVKVNPTKYKMKIERAKEPYTLVFSESFHEGWRAYVSNQPRPRRGEAGGGQPATSDRYYGEIVASYFDGEVKEGEHKNIFLNRNTFETWGKRPISEDRHYLVNGYANSWYITPDDTDGREDYELIVEFYPQRLFYVGMGVTLITFLSCLGYLGLDFMKRRLRKKE